jgi:tRNA dimethylallyltransferase
LRTPNPIPRKVSRLPALAGPTAVGKTAVALALGRRRAIEIVSADSMQVYRGLDAGTAKPSVEERRAVPHRLIDVADPSERYDLAQFLFAADSAVRDARRAGAAPLVVGGAGLYLKGLAEGIFTEPSRDPAVRSDLEKRLEREGVPALHAELERVDPEAAGRISRNDPVRVARALEVFRVTGRPISLWHADPRGRQSPAFPLRLLVLTRRRESLYERIEQRTRAMLSAGWIEEVEGLLARGLDPDLHCFKALGYSIIARRLRENEGFEGLAEAIARETRRFAKRQLTWFRAMKGAVWLDADRYSFQDCVSAAEEILFPKGEE